MTLCKRSNSVDVGLGRTGVMMNNGNRGKKLQTLWWEQKCGSTEIGLRENLSSTKLGAVQVSSRFPLDYVYYTSIERSSAPRCGAEANLIIKAVTAR